MKEFKGPDRKPLPFWNFLCGYRMPHLVGPLQFTTVEGPTGPGLRRLAGEGPEPSSLGGSHWALKSRGPVGGCPSKANPSEQYQSLPSFNKLEMLNQYTDGQDVMLTKHIPTTRTFLLNNKTLMGLYSAARCRTGE